MDNIWRIMIENSVDVNDAIASILNQKELLDTLEQLGLSDHKIDADSILLKLIIIVLKIAPIIFILFYNIYKSYVSIIKRINKYKTKKEVEQAFKRLDKMTKQARHNNRPNE